MGPLKLTATKIKIAAVSQIHILWSIYVKILAHGLQTVHGEDTLDTNSSLISQH